MGKTTNRAQWILNYNGSRVPYNDEGDDDVQAYGSLSAMTDGSAYEPNISFNKAVDEYLRVNGIVTSGWYTKNHTFPFLYTKINGHKDVLWGFEGDAKNITPINQGGSSGFPTPIFDVVTVGMDNNMIQTPREAMVMNGDRKAKVEDMSGIDLVIDTTWSKGNYTPYSGAQLVPEYPSGNTTGIDYLTYHFTFTARLTHKYAFPVSFGRYFHVYETDENDVPVSGTGFFKQIQVLFPEGETQVTMMFQYSLFKDYFSGKTGHKVKCDVTPPVSEPSHPVYYNKLDVDAKFGWEFDGGPVNKNGAKFIGRFFVTEYLTYNEDDEYMNWNGLKVVDIYRYTTYVGEVPIVTYNMVGGAKLGGVWEEESSFSTPFQIVSLADSGARDLGEVKPFMFFYNMNILNGWDNVSAKNLAIYRWEGTNLIKTFRFWRYIASDGTMHDIDVCEYGLHEKHNGTIVKGRYTSAWGWISDRMDQSIGSYTNWNDAEGKYLSAATLTQSQLNDLYSERDYLSFTS